MIEGHKSEIRKLYKIISSFLTLALQSLNKNQSKIQENVKNGEKITNHEKSLSIPWDLNPGPSSSNKHIQHRTECMTENCQPYILYYRLPLNWTDLYSQGFSNQLGLRPAHSEWLHTIGNSISGREAAFANYLNQEWNLCNQLTCV